MELAKKFRHRIEIDPSLSDLGILTTQADVASNSIDGDLVVTFATKETRRQFLELWGTLRVHYRRFGR
jgi:hypothetical protein